MPRAERATEARLLEAKRLADQRFGADEFGIGAAHLGDERRHEAEHHRVRGAEDMNVAHGAPHDAAEDIAAAFVRGQHAIGDEEARRPQVIGDDAVAGAMLALRRHADQIDGSRDQRLEQVDVVVVMDALHHGGDALQPHAGVDRRARQVDALAASDLLELHEHEIPDLDEAVAVGIGAAGRTAGNMVAVVVEYLRARPARAGVAHRPEIIAGRDAHDPALGEPGDLPPEVEGVVVGVEDGDRQAILGEAEFLRDQVPGELDRPLLEIIAEREIPEHLEERVVAGGVADVVEIVVLAAGADALLRRRRPRERRLGAAGEIVLERHHPGVGEHQRRVVPRHQRPGGDGRVPVLLEVGEKLGTDIVDADHARRSLWGAHGKTAANSDRPAGF